MRMLRRRLRRLSHAPERGVSMVEVLVALTMIFGTLVSAGILFTSASASMRVAESTDRATQLASDRIEYIRSLKWDQVGFYVADADYRASVPCEEIGVCALSPIGEATVQLPGSRPVSGSLAPKPLESNLQVAGGEFTVRTDISWALNPVTGNAPVDNWNNQVGHASSGDSSDLIPDYAAKRITVTVTWDTSGGAHSVTNATLRSPTLNEAIPAKLQAPAAQPCDSSITPLCRAWVASGHLLTISGGTVQAGTEILFRASTISAATAVSATVTGGPTVTLTAVAGSNNTEWSGSIPTGTALRPGAARITYSVTGGASAGSAVYTAAFWSTATDPATPSLIRPVDLTPDADATSWVDGALLVDSAKATGDTAPVTGNEPTAAVFCVDATNRLVNYQALVFDLSTIDDQNAPGLKPTVTYTGTYADPAATSGPTVTGTVNPADINHPSASQPSIGGIPAYDASTGYVGPQSATWTSLNTPRWAAGLQRGTVLTGSAVAVTISVTRPRDGVTIERTATVPVQVNCTNAGMAAPNLRLTYNASNALVASWTTAPGATYTLQRTTDPAGTWTTIGVTGSPQTLGGADAPATGVTFYYRIRAQIGADVSDWSQIRAITGP